MMPNRGIWQHTKKMNNVMAVHKTFSLNWIPFRFLYFWQDTAERLHELQKFDPHLGL